MRCAACSEEYTDALDTCPRCRTAGPVPQSASPEAEVAEVAGAQPEAQQADAPAMTDNSNVTTHTTQSANGSTLIEFPGVNRNRPAWRKELSERFREIQQRRAREADFEGEDARRRPGPTPQAQPQAAEAGPASTAKAADSAAKQLGLVPAPDEPELNPLVAAALRRIERARAGAPAHPAGRQSAGRAQAATAAARAVEERPEQTPEADAEAARPAPLVVVQPKQPGTAEQPRQNAKAEPAAPATEAAETKAPPQTSARAVAAQKAAPAAEPLKGREVAHAPEASAQTPPQAAQEQAASRQPKHLAGVLDEFWLERQGIELLPKVVAPELSYDDRAPRLKRMAAALVDLVAVAVLSAPFAAAIELTIGNWDDTRVSGSMALIVALVMFLYQTCSVALAGRTFGMSLCALHAVDARKASVPTTGQCMRRAVVYILSLATFGLGLLYSLFDAEGRTAHDILSGTVVVRK